MAPLDTTEVRPPPTREQILLDQRNNLARQWLDADADRAVLLATLDAARQRIAELERALAAVAQPANPEPE